jgi:hypothetical protein
MSTEDVDAIEGRLSREKREAVRLKAAIITELQLISTTVEAAITRGHLLLGSVEEVTAKLEPIRAYLNIEALVALMKRRDEVNAVIVDITARLRDMGVGD